MIKSPWLPLIASAALSALGWLYADYTHNDRDLISRVTALESHRDDDNNRLDRMEDKLDKILEALHLGSQ